MFIQCRLQAKTQDAFSQSLHDKPAILQLMTCGKVGVMNENTYKVGEVPIYKPMTKEEVLINFDVEKRRDNSETYDHRFDFFMGKVKECLV